MPVCLAASPKLTGLQTVALIDCGATESFVSSSFAHRHRLPTLALAVPRVLRVIDGREIESGLVTHYTTQFLTTGHHTESIQLLVCGLGDYDVVLGTPWLQRHDPTISWSTGSVSFTSPYCVLNCSVQGVSSNAVDVDFSTTPTRVHSLPPRVPSPPVCEIIDEDDLYRLAKDDDLQVYSLSFSTLLPGKAVPIFGCSLTSATDGEITETLPPPSRSDSAEYLSTVQGIVPAQYHDLLPVFSKSAADTLPPHRPYDLKINLLPGTTPPFGPVYSLSELELATLRSWIKENLDKGFIRRSTSSAGSPILFVKKKDGSLRLCVDYRGLNAITSKNRYPLPLIPETLDRLRTAKLFTALDLRGAYNLLRVAPGDEWKTAFRTRYGLFECMVVPFGLTNAPASFQHLMNDILRDVLDVTVTCYLDDILIFSDVVEDHPLHVRDVLTRLLSNGLYVKAEKCHFSVTEVDYLGYRISTSGIGLSPSKVESMLDWTEPTCKKDVERFIGFANAYRGFIPSFSMIAAPIQALSKASSPFVWTEQCAEAFTELKNQFCSAPVLRHYDPNLPTFIETDWSSFAISAILSQTQPDDGSLHPIAYMSGKMTPAECNYGPRDGEMLAIVHGVKVWRRYLEGLTLPFTVITDHATLRYFQTSRSLSRRMARWSEAINHHKYEIVYRQGRLNTQCDALSRRSQYAEHLEEADITPQPVLRPVGSALHASATTTSELMLGDEDTSRTDAALASRITAAVELDPSLTPIRLSLQDPSLLRSKALSQRLSHFSVSDDGLLLYDGLVYIPNSDPIKLYLLNQAHDDPTSGHFGQHKVYELLSRNFTWPGMKSYVDEYVRTCGTCQRVKPAHHKYRGLLQSLPTPTRPWGSLSWDHITDLPQSFGYDSVSSSSTASQNPPTL